MKTLVGGAVAAVLGLIGLSVWWKPFFQLLAGSIPVILLAGGGLALYLGFDELKDTWKKGDDEEADNGADSYKQKIDELEKKIETLETKKS